MPVLALQYSPKTTSEVVFARWYTKRPQRSFVHTVNSCPEVPAMSPRSSRLVVTTFALATMTAAIFALPRIPERGVGMSPASSTPDAPMFQGRGRGGGGGAQAQPVDPLKFRWMGPAAAGRVASV